VSPEPDRWLASVDGGAVLCVRVTPRATHAGVTGLRGDALQIRVTAPPVAGAANQELLEVLAAALAVRTSALSLEAGARGRRKRVRVQGLTVAAVQARIRSRVPIDSARGGD
jgi:uncharacterized protein (TIGR00251 family)